MWKRDDSVPKEKNGDGRAMETILKHAAYGALRRGGIYWLARQRRRKQVVILTYHGVLQQGSEIYVNRNCVSSEMFEKQMRWLKQHYQVLPLAEIVEGLQGRRELPEFAAAVTFDDGFWNNYSVAFPILMRYTIPATLFLTTDFIGTRGKMLWTEHVDRLIFSARVRRLQLQTNGTLMELDIHNAKSRIAASDRIRKFLKTLNPEERTRHIRALERQVDQTGMLLEAEEQEERYRFLNWDEVREMAENGIEIGSHTCSHSIVAHLSPSQAEEELLRSKQKIEAELGRPCRFFSYPNGSEKDFLPRDERLLQELGYSAALSQIYGFNDAGTDLFALRRINIVRSESFSFFMAKVTGVWGELRRLAAGVD